MNNAILNKYFWNKDLEYNFSDKEIALYFFLLRTSTHTLRKNPFNLSLASILSRFGWNKKTLKSAISRLEQAKLIEFAPGNSRGHTYCYKLICVTQASNAERRNSGRKTLALPHTSVLFADVWNKLLLTPNWKNKSTEALRMTLSKLGQFDEAFAIELIERCIIGGWQGLIFSDTHHHYEKWKAIRQNTNGSNTTRDRKAEIVRRAISAIETCKQ